MTGAQAKADGRHQGGYSHKEDDKGKRGGSLEDDAARMGSATAGAGGTPGDAGEAARRMALEGGASDVAAAKVCTCVGARMRVWVVASWLLLLLLC